MAVCLYGHEETIGVEDREPTDLDYVPVEIKVSGTGSIEKPRLQPYFEPMTHPPGLYEEINEALWPRPDSPRDQLKLIRGALRLNVSDLASVLAVSRPTVYAWLEGDEPSPENYTQIVRLRRIADEVERMGIPRFEKLLKRPIFDGLSFLDKLKAPGEPVDCLFPLKRLAEKEHATRSARKASGEIRNNDGFLEQSTPIYESD